MSSFTINHVVLLGRLTKDPELRSLPSGASVCNIRIACNSAHRDAEGNYQERPNYFNVSVLAAYAESVNNYTRKGRRVAIDGRLQWREWETADQQTREAVSIAANSVVFLDSPKGQGGGELDDPSPVDGIDQDFDQEIDQRPLSELGLRPARELVGVGVRVEQQDDLPL
jgi:single-strand DNA-binding protein